MLIISESDLDILLREARNRGAKDCEERLTSGPVGRRWLKENAEKVSAAEARLELMKKHRETITAAVSFLLKLAEVYAPESRPLELARSLLRRIGLVSDEAPASWGRLITDSEPPVRS